MTEVQMWKRYKLLKKNNSRWVCTCPVCDRRINECDQGIGYVKTKRGTDIFVHINCVRDWGKVGDSHVKSAV